MNTPPAPKRNYLNNKDMLREIHKSKTSYCEYIDKKYSVYDFIVENEQECFLPESIEAAKVVRAARLTQEKIDELAATLSADVKVSKKSVTKVLPEEIPTEDLVFRVMTYEHIPLAPGRKKNPKRTADNHAKLNFIPFVHAKFSTFEYGVPVDLEIVGKSHHKNGSYSLTHGAVTDTLARMLMMLTHRYSQRSNWRGYTYVDEMKGQALFQLSQICLQFNEFKSDNPFAYYTASISNAFKRVLLEEKEHQKIRDDLLVNSGQNPSFTRQLEVEEEIRRLREAHDHTDV
jgi:hypothetical protein